MRDQSLISLSYEILGVHVRFIAGVRGNLFVVCRILAHNADIGDHSTHRTAI